MDSPIFLQWQQWESRMQEWLNQPENELDLLDTTSFDRVILTILAIKYEALYQDMSPETRFAVTKQHGERLSTVRLSKTKVSEVEEPKEDDQAKSNLFNKFTDRILSPQQVSIETSSEWQEFDQLCKWHGVAFVQRFARCLPQFLVELISMTSAYQELIHKSAIVSSIPGIASQVYRKNNIGEIFLSIDMKSANFAMLQHIHAIDAHMYPNWSEFLSVFVGQRSLVINSKKLRQQSLGRLPEFYKLEALWKHFMGNIYQTILCPCLDENGVEAQCVALTGDEVVFHLNSTMNTDEVLNLVEQVQKCLVKDNSSVKFCVQAYHIQMFHWEKKHMCFARMFIGESKEKSDLKCVPDKDKNYEQAYKDFQAYCGL